MNDVPKRAWRRWIARKWIAGGDVEGSVSLTQFQLNFTLLSHAGWAGLLFVIIWVWSYFSLWTAYNFYIFFIIAVAFGVMGIVSSQVASNISLKKLTIRNPGKDFDWFHYARLRMAQLLGVFCINCSLLIWGTGGLSSPFIPFYIMVFLLAFNYCRFPKPVTGLTLTFVAFFLTAMLLFEIPWVHTLIPVPIDDVTQTAINSLYRRKFFEAAFITASMLVPLISLYLAAWRTGGDSLPAAAETVSVPAEVVTVRAPASTAFATSDNPTTRKDP